MCTFLGRSVQTFYVRPSAPNLRRSPDVPFLTALSLILYPLLFLLSFLAGTLNADANFVYQRNIDQDERPDFDTVFHYSLYCKL